jgi:hypothetical protein
MVAGRRLNRRTIGRPVLLDVLTVLPLDALPLAHDTNVPHKEPTRSDSGGLSPILILAGVVVTLAAVGALVWLKERVRRLEEAERSEPQAPERAG